MLFNSPEFILGFLPVALGGFFLLGRLAGARAALLWLIAASLFFYGWWNPKFVLLLAGSILANYAFSQHILHLILAARQPQARRWLIAGVTFNLALLGWFKYANFLLSSVTLATGLHTPELHIFLPLAISFFTFQQIMFLVESYYAEHPEAGLLPYAAFIAFFPHLIAGPIVRPRETIPQLMATDLAVPRADHLAEGAMVFLLGLAKKLVLADTFARFADIGFDAAAHGAPLSFVEAWYAAGVLYAANLLRFLGLLRHGDRPGADLQRALPGKLRQSHTRRTNITEFWRRWHITLSGFLREQVYIPLGGNRRGETRRNVNLLATMLLGGLWHGAAWNFVLWGGLHGLYLVIHRQFRRTGATLPPFVGRTLTLLVVVIAWVPFRASSLDATFDMLQGMAGYNGLALPQMIVQAFPPLALIATPVPLLRFLGDARTLSFPEVTACLALGWTIVLALPTVHELSERARAWALTTSFAFTMQALFFAPHVTRHSFLHLQF